MKDSICNHEIIVDNLKISVIFDFGEDNLSEKNIENTDNVMHRHKFNEIFVCTEDNIIIETENGFIQLNKNDIAFIPQNIIHNGSGFNNKNKCYAIGYFLKKISLNTNCYDLYKKCTFPNDKVIKLENVPLICDNLKYIYDNNANINIALRLVTVLEDIISHMSDFLYISNNDDEQHPALDITAKIDKFINGYFMKPLTLSDVADSLYLSERQVTRIMKKYYNKTFFELLNDKRIEVATFMLNDSKNTLGDIALAVGFTNKSSFYREFKKRNSITPSEYRNQNGC